jgi:hypothetical protein
MLRFALLVEGRYLAPWHLTCLERLASSAKLTALVLTPPDPYEPAGWRFLRRRLGGAIVEPTIDVAARFQDIPQFRTESPDIALLDTIDFALAFGRRSVATRLAPVPRYGVWYFQHEITAEALPFFREVTEGEDVTYAALAAVVAPDTGANVLEQGWFRTEKRSYAQELQHVLSSIAEWPARTCNRIAVGCDKRSAGLTQVTVMRPRAHQRPRFLRYGARVAGRRFDFALERVFRHPQWNIGILHTPAGELLRPNAYADRDIEWYPLSGRDRFLADPFGLERDGRLNVFCEEFSYRSSLGHIATLDWSASGQPTKEAIRLPVHASYPCLIEHDGKTYCVPETSRAGEVALFEALQFPTHWRKVGALIEGFTGVDPTVFRHEGRWWLMCTERGRDEDAALHIWYAADLLGPWMPHARNPVKTDVRSARPGGPPFRHEGSLYRAAQDCSKYYGWRVAIQRLNVLTPFEFDEETVAILQASEDSPFPLGRHTFAPVGGSVLVDGHRRVFAWPAFRAFVKIAARDLSARFARHGAAR